LTGDPQVIPQVWSLCKNPGLDREKEENHIETAELGLKAAYSLLTMHSS
jgi:hypothetical protein